MTSPFDLSKFVILPVKAKAVEFAATTDGLKAAILAAIEKASAHDTAGATDPIGANGHPRMLQLSGWITYAEEINLNGRLFLKEDLEAAVANGMFKAPFFGMIDYNHDFSSYGVWYDAKFAYDEVAGKWGIYAEGVMFAWRYTELADKMLAMQARQGHIDLSMACLAEYYESARSPEGIDYLIARKPVFFTTSLLDVDPAFPNSRAYGSESPDSTPESRADQLRTSDGLNKAEEASMKTKTDEQPTELATPAETPVEEEVVLEVATDLEEEPTETPPVVEAPVVETAAEVTIETLTAKVTELETLLATATVSLQANQTELAAMVTTNEALTAELATLAALKTEIDSAAAAEAAAKAREARMGEIPEAIAAEMAKEENAPLLDEWMSMDEARWESTKKVFSLAAAGRKTFADRSAEEGMLPGTRSSEEGKFAISKHLTPALRRGTR